MRHIVPRSRWPLRLAVLVCAAAAAMPASAAGDAARGAQTYAVRCGGCHSVDTDRTGPHHAGVLGRRAGSVAGFDYSTALKNSNIVWNEQTLERWLADPEALVPGQQMDYSLADPALRADVVSYLATLRARK